VDPEIVVIILPFLFEKENINIVITMIINDIRYFSQNKEKGREVGPNSGSTHSYNEVKRSVFDLR